MTWERMHIRHNLRASVARGKSMAAESSRLNATHSYPLTWVSRVRAAAPHTPLVKGMRRQPCVP